MGVSRSASTVIAYAMKEYGWDLDTAFDYVKERRAVTKPNPSFMKQLEEYQGILLARCVHSPRSTCTVPLLLQFVLALKHFVSFPSKQRHNKLWRSHSDSELSDHPESPCKPSSHSLIRSDSHNNNTAPSLHHFLGVAVLQALSAEPEDSAKSNTADAAESRTHSNGVCESAALEEARSDCEDPLPRPQAATVVPEERLDNSASVAVTVPAAVPHPPPSLHILPPTPELPRARRDPPEELFISLPRHKPGELSLNLPERSSSQETLGSSDSDLADQSLSDLSNDKSSNTPFPLVPSLAPTDDNNNPSQFPSGGALDNRGDADGSSNHSADSIDFLSAREMFLGLAQDGRTWTHSEQAQQRSALSHEDSGETHGKGDEDQGSESQVSLIGFHQNVLFCM